MISVRGTIDAPVLKLAVPPPELLPASPKTFHSATVQAAAALTALSPVRLYMVVAPVDRVTLSLVDVTAADILIFPRLLMGWLGTWVNQPLAESSAFL